MQGLLKTWRMVAVIAEKRMTKAKARKAKGENARIERVVRVLRNGAISRAGKALESKGLEGLDDALVTRLRLKRPIYVLNFRYCNIHF